MFFFNTGNTHDEDSDKEPEPPVKVIDKTPARTTKRNAPAEAPASKAPVATDARRRGGYSGNEAGKRILEKCVMSFFVHAC